jgi:hypothetical protein
MPPVVGAGRGSAAAAWPIVAELSAATARTISARRESRARSGQTSFVGTGWRDGVGVVDDLDRGLGAGAGSGKCRFAATSDDRPGLGDSDGRRSAAS